MTVYAIGDIQGCYKELRQLLKKIAFSSDKDQLWFVGDLVNRGPDSLAVLRFIKDLAENAISVLGNHDLHMLGVLTGVEKPRKKDTFEEIIHAKDRDSIIDWVRSRPLVYIEEESKHILVHAGIYPNWSIVEAKAYAAEMEAVLQSDHYLDFINNMYGSEPSVWSNTLEGWDRLRFITNSFTRMRYCTVNAELDMKHKGPPGTQPNNLMPWYKIRNKELRSYRVLMGHWSTLGNVNDPQLITLDTGCLWGGSLTAYALEEPPRFTALACAVTQSPH